MILSGREILRHIGKEIVIDPFDERRLNPNSYNLTLQPEGIPKKYMTRNGLAAAVSAIIRNPDSIGKVYTIGAGG